MSRDIFIAKVIAPHGLNGEMKVKVEDENDARFIEGRRLYLGRESLPVTVERYRSQGLYGILKLAEFKSINEIDRFRDQLLMADEAELPPLPEGRYYVKDLIGLPVFDQHGRKRGVMKDVLPYDVNDIYVVKTPTGEALIPAVKAIIQSVDLQSGIIVNAIKGLFDEN